MPINPNIALQGQPIQLPDFAGSFRDMMAGRVQQQQLETGKLQQQAAQLALDKAKKDQAEDATVDRLAMELIPIQGIDAFLAAVKSQVGFDKYSAVEKSVKEQRLDTLKLSAAQYQDRLLKSEAFRRIVSNVTDDDSLQFAVRQAFEAELVDAGSLPYLQRLKFTPELKQRLELWGATSEEILNYRRAKIKLEGAEEELRQQKELYPFQKRAEIAKAVTAEQTAGIGLPPVTKEDYYSRIDSIAPSGENKALASLGANAKTLVEHFLSKNDKSKADAVLVNLANDVASLESKSNPLDDQDEDSIAQGVIDGIVPPDLKGLYRKKAGVVATLARKGFNQVAAVNEWNAVQRHISTMNGPQQLRLRQALEKIGPHVSYIRKLYAEWQKTKLPGGFKLYNKAALVAASNLPGAAGELANRLNGQIVDLQSELANVFMSGNTPTDHALQMAANNLKTEWNEDTFNGALEDIVANTTMRRNAVRFTSPAGVPSDSAYLPNAGEAPEPEPTPKVQSGSKSTQGKKTNPFR